MAASTKSASRSYTHLIVSVLLLFSQVTHVLSVEGRLFFLAFMDPTPNTNPNSGIEEIHISGSENADSKVRVQVKALNKTYMYMLNSTNKWSKTLTVFEDLAGPSGTKLPISVIVSSEKPISVQVNKAEDGTSGGYLALPITVESTEYYVASYTPRGPGQGFSIGSPDYTCVTVYKQNGPESIREMDISLDAGQVYHVQPGDDSTGRYVVSMKPIALFSGLDCAYIAKDTPSVAKCDHIIEQLHPKFEYGSIFVMSSFQGRKWSNGFQIRVVATFLTTVRWAEMEYDPTSNTPKAPVVKTEETVRRGNYLELTAGRGTNNPVVVMLTCSTPCEVMQYGVSNDMPPAGNEPDGNKPDSTMITVPGLAHYTNDITFSTSKSYSASGNQTLENVNGITVVCKKSELSQLKFDGQPLTSGLPNAKTIDLTFPPSLSSPVAEDNVIVPPDPYTVVYGGPITPGFHRVTSGSDAIRYMVYVYGHAPSSSPSDSAGYAYLGGYRYTSESNAPITEGPWFDFSAPVSETPVVTQPGPKPGQPGGPVQPTEYPVYQSIWEAHFYILNPHLEDLKTKNCSEAYERYYKEERLAPMQKKVNEMTAQSCAAGTTVALVHELYFSQYTDGQIRLRVSVSANSSVTLNEMFDCLAMVADHISYIKNWVPVDYKDETSFLRPDAYYNRGCDRLHMKTPKFESYYFGWNCPTRGGLTGVGAAASVKASFGLLVGLALFLAMLLHQR